MKYNRNLKVGIIGCGGIANAKHMPSLKALGCVELVAFCDIIPEKAEKAKKEFGTKDALVCSDYRDLIKEESIDVVHVCTPNKSHSEITVASLRSGKHVMCEKPMAKTAKEALEMVKAAEETGKKLTIGYQHRHKPESTYLKKAITRGDLGDIYFAKSYALRRRGTPNWGVFLNEEEQGGGPLIDIGTHSLDLTLWMMDNYDPRMVVGTQYKKLLNPDCGNPWGPWDVDQHTVEDAAFGFIVMKNGATIILESSWALNILNPPGEGNLILCGDKAGAQILNGLSFNKDEFGKLVEIKPDLSAGGVAYYDGIQETPALLEAKRWIDAVLNDTEVTVKPRQAYVVSQILESVYQSAASGKPVFFD
jgi:predicted dehydrogenase